MQMCELEDVRMRGYADVQIENVQMRGYADVQIRRGSNNLIINTLDMHLHIRTFAYPHI